MLATASSHSSIMITYVGEYNLNVIALPTKHGRTLAVCCRTPRECLVVVERTGPNIVDWDSDTSLTLSITHSIYTCCSTGIVPNRGHTYLSAILSCLYELHPTCWPIILFLFSEIPLPWAYLDFWWSSLLGTSNRLSQSCIYPPTLGTIISQLLRLVGRSFCSLCLREHIWISVIMSRSWSRLSLKSLSSLLSQSWLIDVNTAWVTSGLYYQGQQFRVNLQFHPWSSFACIFSPSLVNYFRLGYRMYGFHHYIICYGVEFQHLKPSNALIKQRTFVRFP